MGDQHACVHGGRLRRSFLSESPAVTARHGSHVPWTRPWSRRGWSRPARPFALRVEP